jgi:hypothetical protein
MTDYTSKFDGYHALASCRAVNVTSYLCFNKTVTIIGQHPKDRGCVFYPTEAVGRRRSG